MSSWLEDYLRQNVPLAGCMDADQFHLDDAEPVQLLIPQKEAFTMLVPNELLMDVGAIPDTRPPRKPPTRRERFRWWRTGLRDRIATWTYERISGGSFPDREDY